MSTLLDNVNQLGSDTKFPKYEAFDGYPRAFQAAAFPIQGDTTLTGNNLAFFFAKPVKDGDRITGFELNTTHLKTLLKNAMDNGHAVSLQVDSDLLLNHEKFVEKYGSLRPEENGADLLLQEAVVISSFIGNGCIREVVSEIVESDRQAYLSDGRKVADAVQQYVNSYVSIKGVQTENALECATWEVVLNDEEKSTMIGVQQYSNSTQNTLRPWSLGRDINMRDYAEQGNETIATVLKQFDDVSSLPTVDFTNGINQDLGNAQIQTL